MTFRSIAPALTLLSLLSACGDSTAPPPTVEAAISVSPSSGDTNTSFAFNAAASTSSGQTPSLEYRWDWDSDGGWDQDWSSSASATHTYPVAGQYTVRAEVRDGSVSDQATVGLVVAPVVQAALAVSPSAGTVLTDFEFDAGASSSTAGTPGLEFRWDLDGDGTWDTEWSTESSRVVRFSDDQGPEVRVQARDAGVIDDIAASVTLNLNHGQLVDSLAVDASLRASGLTHDGEHFWVSQYGAGTTLSQVSSQTGQVLRSFPSHSIWTGRLTWDGTHLWQESYTNSAVLVQIDPATGTAVSSFPVIYSTRPSGLCWDGLGFYRHNQSGTLGGDDRIHKVDNTGVELLAFDIPAGTPYATGLACDGGDLFYSTPVGNLIHVLDPTTGAVKRTFVDWGVSAITIVDGYLWGWGYNGTAYMLYKLVP